MGEVSYPERVWEPVEKPNGDLVIPLRWASRPATAEDRLRRGTGWLQEWQMRHKQVLREMAGQL